MFYLTLPDLFEETLICIPLIDGMAFLSIIKQFRSNIKGGQSVNAYFMNALQLIWNNKQEEESLTPLLCYKTKKKL